MAAPTYYEILGVTAQATTEEVRKAYHRLARQNHPDRIRDPEERKRAEERFTAMTEAFNVLTDAGRRSEYDTRLRDAARGGNPTEREAKAYARTAQTRLEEGNAAEAVRLYRAALHLEPNQGPHHAGLARALDKAGQTGEALRAWDEAIRREPSNAAYYRQAGACLEKAGMTVRARRMYESAVKWDPTDQVSAAALARLSGEERKPGLLGGIFKRT